MKDALLTWGRGRLGHCQQGQQMTASHLFRCSLGAKNGFHIFKCLNKNLKDYFITRVSK